MNTQPQQPHALQIDRIHRPWRWVWAATLLSLLVCALIAWLHYQQRQMLAQSIGDKERCLAAGATDYMTRPVRLRALAELIQQLLDTSDAQR